MFKVGDTVRRTSGSFEGLVRDGIYKIDAVSKSGNWLGLAGTVKGSDPTPFYYESFVLAKEAPTSRSTDPVTSKGKRKVNKYEQAVLNSLAGRIDGMTGKDIAYDTGHPLNCITPRFAPLRRKGLIDAKRTADEPGGPRRVVKRDKQIVWVLA